MDSTIRSEHLLATAAGHGEAATMMGSADDGGGALATDMSQSYV